MLPDVVLRKIPSKDSYHEDHEEVLGSILCHRYSIKNRVYPAILPVDKIEVIGKVLFGITDPELCILDEFEDFEYERNIVEVSLVESSEILQAYAYVWRNKSDPDLYGDWDLKEWKEKHIDNYLVMTCSFAAELEKPEC